MGDGVSESRASSLAKGFESTAPAWLAQAQPCASLPIRVNPAHPWLKNDFAVHYFAKMECRASNIQSRVPLNSTHSNSVNFVNFVSKHPVSPAHPAILSKKPFSYKTLTQKSLS
jgi:hypothetical protein